MSATGVRTLRELSRQPLLASDLPTRQPDTVIVKLRTAPSAVRRFATAAAASAGSAAAVARPFLAELVANGYASRLTPIFAADPPLGAHRPRRALAAAVESTRPLKAAQGLVSIALDRATDADELVAHLNRRSDEVEYAYVPAIKYPCLPRPATSRARAPRSSDPLASRQWGHAAVKIHAARARAGFRNGSDVVVAVVDSGIDRGHPDLTRSIHSYVNFLSSEDDRDYQGHGTHVAGIIGASIGNRTGIAGLCAARIMALKGLPREGGTWDAAAYYRALAHPIDHGARVLNLSLGGAIDPGERDVILDLLDAGVVVVAAMGNEYLRGNPVSYPAAYPGVIAVGASDEADRRASFSCTGRHIALVAPGERILSTVPRYPSELAEEVLYDSWPGTSMAAPHVAAAAALLLAKDPSLTPAQVRRRLMTTADRTPWQSSTRSREYGSGRLNVAAALA